MLFALPVFIFLLIAGNYLGELRLWQTLLFIGIIVATFFAFITFHLPGMYLTGAIALIDIVLSLIVFKGNFRI